MWQAYVVFQLTLARRAFVGESSEHVNCSCNHARHGPSNTANKASGTLSRLKLSTFVSTKIIGASAALKSESVIIDVSIILLEGFDMGEIYASNYPEQGYGSSDEGDWHKEKQVEREREWDWLVRGLLHHRFILILWSLPPGSGGRRWYKYG